MGYRVRNIQWGQRAYLTGVKKTEMHKRHGPSCGCDSRMMEVKGCDWETAILEESPARRQQLLRDGKDSCAGKALKQALRKMGKYPGDEEGDNDVIRRCWCKIRTSKERTLNSSGKKHSQEKVFQGQGICSETISIPHPSSSFIKQWQ